ncbi:THUMP-like domain-containing protein [Streptomyces lasiicapitis]|uniref:THUMP-like domain-containing protein n=1 Tax=Streptomyces lasiicapitis TaxID=1923961 RepID=UPI0036A551AD
MDLRTFEGLLTERGQVLLAAVSGLDPAGEMAAQLRGEYPAEWVSAAVEQVRLRRRAVAKFGVEAYRMYFTPDSLEHSSPQAVAAYRGVRILNEFGIVNAGAVGCGVVGDAVEMARAPMVTVVVDQDPLACAVTQANMRALGGIVAEFAWAQQCADLAAMAEEAVRYSESVFISLAQRRGREGDVGAPAYWPPLEWALDVVREVGEGAVKVPPDIAGEAIPDCSETEWISYGGQVTEAVLWFGLSEHDADRPDTPVPHGVRRATVLPGGASLTSRGLPAPAVCPVGRYLYEPDDAVVRAGLLAEVAQDVGGGLIDETATYLTADTLHATAFATAYEITDVLPYDVEKLQALLRERGIGELSVKERGAAVVPDELSRLGTPPGPNTATVILTRAARVPVMLLGRPIG